MKKIKYSQLSKDELENEIERYTVEIQRYTIVANQKIGEQQSQVFGRVHDIHLNCSLKLIDENGTRAESSDVFSESLKKLVPGAYLVSLSNISKGGVNMRWLI